MKIDSSIGTTEQSGNQFTIAATGKAFRILSDGLYADKIKAIIRELSCNARDSHVAAGNAQPWDLHLPTDREPWFEVRDYGTGMSHEQITDIYTRYFASTKTSSNDFVGQLGLGSKSPFSYTREFSVESRHDGKNLRYRMFFDDTDTPRVEHISEGVAQDTGLAVRFPVVGQHDRWIEKAGEVLRWFDTKPNLTGAQCYMSSPTVRWEGSGWRIFETDGRNDQAMAIMGGVCYPISWDSIPGITEDQHHICRVSVAIDFGIGDLDVAASREGLSYDPRTCAGIAARLDTVVSEITALFRDSVAKQPTEWLARRTWREWMNGNTYHLQQILRDKKVDWQGKEIASATKAINFSDLYAQGDSGIKLWAHGYKGSTRPTSLSLRCDDQTLIIFDDLDKGGLSRAKHRHLSTNMRQVTVLLGPSSNMGWDAMRDAIGGPEVVMASTLPKPPSQASAGQNGKIEAYVMRDYSDGRHGWKAAEPADTDTANGTVYWVEMRGWDVLHPNGTGGSANGIRAIAGGAKALGMIPQDAKIIGMRQRFAKKMRGAKGWTSLIEHVRGKTVELCRTGSVLQDMSDVINLRKTMDDNWSNTGGIRSVLGSASREWIDSLRDQDSTMRSLYDRHHQARSRVGKSTEALESLIKSYGINVELPPPTVDFADLLREATERYSMLRHASIRWSESVASDVKRYIDTVDMSYTWEILSRDAE